MMTELAALPENTPIMLEHLPDADAYARAADCQRCHAAALGITL